MSGTLQYDTFSFPNNPETLQITYRREVSVENTSDGSWTIQNIGQLGRIVEGEGVFYGENAYESFSTLAKYIYSFQALILQHPKWEAFRAHLTRLESIEEPCESCVRYRFTFIESPDAP